MCVLGVCERKRDGEVGDNLYTHGPMRYRETTDSALFIERRDAALLTANILLTLRTKNDGGLDWTLN